MTLAPTNATILDTLAWIEHLLGHHHEASKRLAEAIRRDPNNPSFVYMRRRCTPPSVRGGRPRSSLRKRCD